MKRSCCGYVSRGQFAGSKSNCLFAAICPPVDVLLCPQTEEATLTIAGRSGSGEVWIEGTFILCRVLMSEAKSSQCSKRL